MTKPGWSKPHTHSNPTNLALFRHKITLYRFNQGAHTIAGGAQMGAGAESPPSPLTLTTGLKVACQDRGAEIETPKAVRGRDVGGCCPLHTQLGMSGFGGGAPAENGFLVHFEAKKPSKAPS